MEAPESSKDGGAVDGGVSTWVGALPVRAANSVSCECARKDDGPGVVKVTLCSIEGHIVGDHDVERNPLNV